MSARAYRIYPYTNLDAYLWWLGFLIGLQLAILYRAACRLDDAAAAAADVTLASERLFVAPAAGPATEVPERPAGAPDPQAQ